MNFEHLFQNLTTLGVSLGGKIIAALLVLFIGLKITKFIVKLVIKSKVFHAIDVTAQTFLKSVLNIALKAIVFITAIGVLGVPLTSVVTVVASCGVAVGLALQGGLSNLAGGIIIIILKPFKVGDYIIEGGVEGTVEAIGIFYTTLATPDNKRITVPNGLLSNATVINYSAEETRRVDMEFTVAYGTDIEKVNKVLLTVAGANDKILKDPAPFAALHRQGDSALVFVLRSWCKNSDYWNVYFYLEENMTKAFTAMGIEIPFNQLDVHIAKTED
jgi:small conductance mechanosensitive channel